MVFLAHKHIDSRPAFASFICQLLLAMSYVFVTELSLRKPKYEVDLAIFMISIYQFRFMVNSLITFYHSWIYFACCVTYYMVRNSMCYGLEQTLILIALFSCLVPFNLFCCYEDEAILRENFRKKHLAKQFRNSLHSVLEVFPDSILIKNDDTHHF